MNTITKETREESFSKILDELGERQQVVHMGLGDFEKGITAKGLAVYLHTLGLVATPERNSVHPRLNELIKKGLVEVIGKQTCNYTNRKVAVYKLKENT